MYRRDAITRPASGNASAAIPSVGSSRSGRISAAAFSSQEADEGAADCSVVRKSTVPGMCFMHSTETVLFRSCVGVGRSLMILDMYHEFHGSQVFLLLHHRHNVAIKNRNQGCFSTCLYQIYRPGIKRKLALNRAHKRSLHTARTPRHRLVIRVEEPSVGGFQRPFGRETLAAKRQAGRFEDISLVA